MSHHRKLRTELSILEKSFPRNDGVFQIILASPEELVCRFYDPKGSKYNLQCSISPSYPVVLPIWISECNEPFFVQLVEDLNVSDEAGTHPLLGKVRHIVSKLCEHCGIPPPPVVAELFSMASSAQVEDSDSDNMQKDIDSDEVLSESADSQNGDEEEEEEEEEEDGDDGFGDEMFADEDLDMQASEHEDMGGDMGIADDNKAILERVRMNTRQEYLHGTTSGSVRATDRLMRELQDIYRSQNFKNGMYTVDLIDDCLYSWNIKLYKVDPDSSLSEDMKKLKETEGVDHMLLHIAFDDKFPYSPPFVRVVKPVITGGYVLAGGAICMELLTPQGWSSAYTIEAVILQIGATLVKGKARIVFSQTKGEPYTLAKAQHAYKSLVKIHEKSGWFTPPKDEG